MPLDFPNAPNVNDTFTSNGRSWKWNGATWDLVPIAHTHATADLVDFTVASPATNQALLFNGTKWANRAIAQTDVTNLAADIAAKANLSSPTITTPTLSGRAVVSGTNSMDTDSDWNDNLVELYNTSNGNPGIAWHAPGASAIGVRHVRGTMALQVIGSSGYIDVGANKSLRNITVNTAAPSGGSDGDVWLTYTP